MPLLRNQARDANKNRARLKVELPVQIRTQIRIGGGGVLALVARDLAFTVAKADGLAVCTGCGRGYIPRRRPRQGESNWCDDCRPTAAAAARMRRFRAKKRRESEE